MQVLNDTHVNLHLGYSTPWIITSGSPAGLVVLMASAVVVLKQVTSTLRQSHNYISIDFTFGADDYVRHHAGVERSA